MESRNKSGALEKEGQNPKVSALKLRSSKPSVMISSPPWTFMCLKSQTQRGVGPNEDLQVSCLRCVLLLSAPLRAWLGGEAGWLEIHCFSLQGQSLPSSALRAGSLPRWAGWRRTERWHSWLSLALTYRELIFPLHQKHRGSRRGLELGVV